MPETTDENKKRTIAGHLQSCALAAAAAVVSLLLAPPEVEGVGRGALAIVGIAAIAVVGAVLWIAWSNQGGDGAAHDGRKRGVSLLWLGLTVAIGAAMARELVCALVDGSTSNASPTSWLAGLAGAAFIAVAVWRIAVTLRSR